MARIVGIKAVKGHVCGSSPHCIKIFGDTQLRLFWGEDTPAGRQRMDSKGINTRSESVWKVGCDGPLNMKGGLGRGWPGGLRRQCGISHHSRESEPVAETCLKRKKARFPFRRRESFC